MRPASAAGLFSAALARQSESVAHEAVASVAVLMACRRVMACSFSFVGRRMALANGAVNSIVPVHLLRRLFHGGLASDAGLATKFVEVSTIFMRMPDTKILAAKDSSVFSGSQVPSVMGVDNMSM